MRSPRPQSLPETSGWGCIGSAGESLIDAVEFTAKAHGHDTPACGGRNCPKVGLTGLLSTVRRLCTRSTCNRRGVRPGGDVVFGKSAGISTSAVDVSGSRRADGRRVPGRSRRRTTPPAGCGPPGASRGW